MYSKSFKNYNQENENIKVFLAINPYSEIEYVAKNIITLVKNSNYRYKDISVITNDLDNYSNLISVIFEQYDIPVFIDESKNLNQNPLIKYVVSGFKHVEASIFKSGEIYFVSFSIVFLSR